MADALAMQAMSTQPIQSPWQGAAKLAQAFVAAKMMKGATGREDELMAERAKAFSEALAPNIVEARPEGDILPLEQISGVTPEDYGSIAAAAGGPGQVTEFLQKQQYEVPKTAEQILQALPTDMAEGVMGAIMQQNIMAQMGITPQQLAAQYRQGRDPYEGYASLGQRMIEIPNQEPFEAAVMRHKESGQLGLMGANGQFTPVDSRWVKDVIDRTQEVPFGEGTFKGFEENMIQAGVALDQIGRLRGYISGTVPGMTLDSAVGAARDFGNRMVTTVEQIGKTIYEGLRPDENKLVTAVDAKGRKINYQDWGSVMSDYQSVLDGGGRQYSKEEIEANKSFFKRFAALDAATQQLSISIAYTLARIADPGGRLSEMDVINQMRGLGMDQASPEKRLAALGEAERTFAKTVQLQIRYARARASSAGVPVFVDPEMEYQINNILSGRQQTQAAGPMDLPQQVLYMRRVLEGPDSELRQQIVKDLRTNPLFAAQYGLDQYLR
jgi:hypothetical protein